MTDQWDTPEKIAEATEAFAASVEGWQEPAAYAVGISSATSSPECDFPVVNAGTRMLPALVMAKVVGHVSGTATYPLTTSQLEAAIAGLSPAEACTAYEHRNLGAWRSLLADAQGNPARTLTVVYIGDLEDPVGSEADASLRALIEGHEPLR